MRRRIFRGRGRRRSGGLLGALRDRPEMALAEVSPLERVPGLPDGVEIGIGQRDDGTASVLVASRTDGPWLLGWGAVAAYLAETEDPPSEVVVAAPILGRSTCRLAEQIGGRLPRRRLVAIPALAEAPDEIQAQEIFPCETHGLEPAASPVLARLLRVIEGAAALTDVAVVRRTHRGFALYVRGVRVLHLEPEGDGVAATFVEPDRRQAQVRDSNFPRWGLDLHEQVLQIARDPRLLDRPEAARDAAIESIASAAGARVTARWIPWNDDGSRPIEWFGTDAGGRPVLGFVRDQVGLVDVPAVAGALAGLAGVGALPAPGGSVSVIVSADSCAEGFEEVLATIGVEVVGSAAAPRLEAPAPSRAAGERERRGRRRSRRRRRGRGEGAPASQEAPGALRGREEERDEALGGERPDGRERPEERPRFDPRERPEEGPRLEPRERMDDGEDREPEEGTAFAERERDFEPASDEEIAAGPVGPTETAGFADGPAPDGPEPRTERETDLDAQATEEEFAREGEEAPPEEEEEIAGDASPEEEGPEVPREARPRRSRAAIVVHQDRASLLAGMVLARDRRHVVQFWVCRQDQLMDFFKTGATDLPENVDILVVGFTAQPVPKEILQTAEVYRGRLQWLDHHPWPVEDLELLREAVGDEAIVVVEGAATPLAAVSRVLERRSRFTDKLVDFAAGRLSENDMGKWGFRLAALLARLESVTGDRRNDLVPVLAGKPSNLPEGDEVFAEEDRWLQEHDPRVVHFGDYQMVVVHVPERLDPSEVGRRARLRTGARLSLGSREGDGIVSLVANEEKRPVNVQGLAEQLASRLPWVELRISGDRAARMVIDDLPRHPERRDLLISEIARQKSILYG